MRALPLNPFPCGDRCAVVFDAATALDVGREVATAFVAYQNFNCWQMNGAKLVDWQKALSGFAKADHQRKRALKIDGITNGEFWGFVGAEKIERPTANAWVSAMKKRAWKLPNPANGRLEPVQDFRAALRAFVGSELNQILESVGNYDE